MEYRVSFMDEKGRFHDAFFATKEMATMYLEGLQFTSEDVVEPLHDCRVIEAFVYKNGRKLRRLPAIIEGVYVK